MKDLPPLWAHQALTIERAKVEKDFGLFHDPGTGKTRTLIEILRNLYNTSRQILPTLILCPPVVIPNWKKEILKYSNIPEKKVVLLTGPGTRRLELFKSSDPQSIFVTNYEALEMKPLFEAMLGLKVIVLDESHRIKNPTAIRTKKATLLCDQALHCYLLTGTPILNSLMDVYAQFRAMDGGETFGKNFFGFRAQYFWDRNAGMPKQKYFPLWIPRPDTETKLRELIAKKTTTAKKSECLDLPPLVRKEIEVNLSPQQERLYNEMKKDFITFLEDKACVASLALTKALRLQQIVSGFIKTDDGSEHSFSDNPRTEALRGVLEDLVPNHKVVIWAVFKENYAQIAKVCERLKVGYVQLHGETPTKDRERAIESFTRDDSIRVFISNPGAGGIGINLVEASYSIFFSRSFSLEHDLQAEARNYRGGSERHDKITRIDLVARGTIDEIVLQSLANKQELASKILSLKNLL